MSGYMEERQYAYSTLSMYMGALNKSKGIAAYKMLSFSSNLQQLGES